MELTLWVVLIVSFAQQSFQQNWCGLRCDNGAENTMCIYSHVTNKNKCTNQKDAMTDAVKKKILGLHNYVRNEIAAGNVKGWPAAANMRQMSWDDEVAAVALRWTLQCTPGHDQCRRTQAFPKVGQNWGTGADSRDYPDGAFYVFKAWLSEIGQTSDKIVDKFYFHYSYGHYTALVWAETYKIGCGLVNSTLNRMKSATLTCNYAPSGNIRTLPMWLKGDPCTQCPSGTKCKPNSSYRNLCATPDDPIDEVPIPIDISTAGPQKFESIPLFLHAFPVVISTSAIL